MPPVDARYIRGNPFGWVYQLRHGRENPGSMIWSAYMGDMYRILCTVLSLGCQLMSMVLDQKDDQLLP